MSAYVFSLLQYKEVSRDDNDQPDCVAKSYSALLQNLVCPSKHLTTVQPALHNKADHHSTSNMLAESRPIVSPTLSQLVTHDKDSDSAAKKCRKFLSAAAACPSGAHHESPTFFQLALNLLQGSFAVRKLLLSSC